MATKHKYINNKDIQVLADKFVLDRMESSFNQLMKVCEKGLRYYISEYTKSKYDIDSIFSRTMESLYFKIDKYKQSRGKFTTWMFKIAHNVILNYIERGEYTHKIKTTDIDVSILYSPVIDDVIADEELDDIDYLLFDGITWTLYNNERVLSDIYDTSIECIDNLPENFKLAMKERYINRKRIKDIAKDNNKTKIEVKSYLHFGSKKLSKDVIEKNQYLYKRFMEIA